jgi:formylglycine-generating enzyme required for sulfatase activity
MGSFSPESDIYSLGATLYFMLTGTTPPSAPQLIRRFIIPDAVSPQMAAVIRAAMLPNKEDRPQSIAAFLALLDGEAAVADEETKPLQKEEETKVFVEEETKAYNEPARQPFEPEMVFVEGGTFMMGIPTSEQIYRFDEDAVQHPVTVSSFRIGKYPVTQGQWEAVMGYNPSMHKKGDNYPVERVDWYDIQTFLQRLNAITGKRYRLPTEAEWEYAARGGSCSNGYLYSGSNNVDDVAWYDENSGSSTHPVGQKLPNELGIYDMSGNVLEWCSDWDGDYSTDAQINPKGPSSGSNRVTRGGGYYRSATDCRVADRTFSLPPGESLSEFGFRVVLP